MKGIALCSSVCVKGGYILTWWLIDIIVDLFTLVWKHTAYGSNWSTPVHCHSVLVLSASRAYISGSFATFV